MLESSKQLKFGAVLSYISIGLNILSGLLYTPWMIHSIGQENYGLYTLALSVITLFVFDFGLSAAVTRFIARYLAEGKQDKVNNILGLVYRLYIIIDVVLFFVLLSIFFFIPDIYLELTPDEMENFKVVYCMVAFYAILSFPFIPINGILAAYECFIQMKICDILHKLIIVGCMTLCLILGYGLYALVMVNAVSGLVIIGFKLWSIKRFTFQKVNWSYFNKCELKEIASYSGWVTVIALAQRCIFNIAPTILGALSGSLAIAIFGIAMTLEGYAYTFANALNGMFLPKVSRIISNKSDILPLMIRVCRIQIFIIGLVVSGVLCFCQDFITLWVGNSFEESYLCAVLIILPSFFHLPQTVVVETLYVENKVKDLSKVFIIMALINILGAIVLVRDLGALGISFSIFVAYMVRTIGMDYIVYKKLKINLLYFLNQTYVKLSFPLLFCLILGFSFKYIIPVVGWTILFVKVALYCGVYCIISYTFGMNQYEKNLVLGPFVKYFKKTK